MLSFGAGFGGLRRNPDVKEEPICRSRPLFLVVAMNDLPFFLFFCFWHFPLVFIFFPSRSPVFWFPNWADDFVFNWQRGGGEERRFSHGGGRWERGYLFRGVALTSQDLPQGKFVSGGKGRRNKALRDLLSTKWLLGGVERSI